MNFRKVLVNGVRESCSFVYIVKKKKKANLWIPKFRKSEIKKPKNNYKKREYLCLCTTFVCRFYCKLTDRFNYVKWFWFWFVKSLIFLFLFLLYSFVLLNTSILVLIAINFRNFFSYWHCCCSSSETVIIAVKSINEWNKKKIAINQQQQQQHSSLFH